MQDSFHVDGVYRYADVRMRNSMHTHTRHMVRYGTANFTEVIRYPWEYPSLPGQPASLFAALPTSPLPFQGTFGHDVRPKKGVGLLEIALRHIVLLAATVAPSSAAAAVA